MNPIENEICCLCKRCLFVVFVPCCDLISESEKTKDAIA